MKMEERNRLACVATVAAGLLLYGGMRGVEKDQTVDKPKTSQTKVVDDHSTDVAKEIRAIGCASDRPFVPQDQVTEEAMYEADMYRPSLGVHCGKEIDERLDNPTSYDVETAYLNCYGDLGVLGRMNVDAFWYERDLMREVVPFPNTHDDFIFEMERSFDEAEQLAYDLGNQNPNTSDLRQLSEPLTMMSVWDDGQFQIDGHRMPGHFTEIEKENLSISVHMRLDEDGHPVFSASGFSMETGGVFSAEESDSVEEVMLNIVDQSLDYAEDLPVYDTGFQD